MRNLAAAVPSAVALSAVAPSAIALSAVALSVLALSAPAPAQSTRVVPAVAVARDMNASSVFPFVYNVFHYQQVWTGSAIASQGATLGGIAFRRDVQDNSTYTGHAYPQITLRLTHTPVAPGSMATTFSQNTPNPTTTVFSGAFNAPTLQPDFGIPAFGIAFPFSVPFAYVVSQGNLLLDLEAPATALPKKWYPIDAEYVGLDGRASNFGSAGTFASGETPSITFSSNAGGLANLVPGGQMAVRVSGLMSPYTTWIVFGLSTQFWVGGPLPFEMTPLGAAGNTLYTSIDALTPALTPTQAGARWQVDFLVGIPAIAAIAGESFYNQSIHLDAASNSLGAVLSGGLHALIGGMGGSSVTQLMGTPSTTSTSGALLFGSNATGGPVVEFTGTFN